MQCASGSVVEKENVLTLVVAGQPGESAGLFFATILAVSRLEHNIQVHRKAGAGAPSLRRKDTVIYCEQTPNDREIEFLLRGILHEKISRD